MTHSFNSLNPNPFNFNSFNSFNDFNSINSNAINPLKSFCQNPYYIEDFANKIEDIFAFAIDKRYRNFFVRLDLRFPDDGCAYDEAWVFGEFIRVFKQNRERNFGDVFFFSAREKDKSIHGHYHLCFLLDGMTTDCTHRHFLKAEELWGKYLSKDAGHTINASGLVQYGKEFWWDNDPWPFSVPRPQQCHGVMITRDNSETFHAHLYFCRKQAMYLAKACTKNTFGANGRSWSSTHGIPSRHHLVNRYGLTIFT